MASEITVHSTVFFTPQPLRAPGYCRRPGGRAVGRAAARPSTVRALTSVIFHGSFSNLVRRKISDDFDYAGSASLNMRVIDHLMSRVILAFLCSFFKLKSQHLVQM